MYESPRIGDGCVSFEDECAAEVVGVVCQKSDLPRAVFDLSPAMEGYQLSAVFAEKQLELLERKYGGSYKAGEAALTIQRAFRR